MDKGRSPSKGQGSSYRLDRQETSGADAFSKSLKRMASALSRRNTAKSSVAKTSEFDEREIRSFEENVAILRCATAIVFPPKRRYFLSKMKDVFTPVEFNRLAR